jgi:hypothetical protein
MGREGGYVLVAAEGPLLHVLDREGGVPLPSYLERAHGPTALDRSASQTAFAQESSAMAAPTASLHFTPRSISISARLAQIGCVPQVLKRCIIKQAGQTPMSQLRRHLGLSHFPKELSIALMTSFKFARRPTLMPKRTALGPDPHD